MISGSKICDWFGSHSKLHWTNECQRPQNFHAKSCLATGNGLLQRPRASTIETRKQTLIAHRWQEDLV